jgi:hypothetical protein
MDKTIHISGEQDGRTDGSVPQHKRASNNNARKARWKLPFRGLTDSGLSRWRGDWDSKHVARPSSSEMRRLTDRSTWPRRNEHWTYPENGYIPLLLFKANFVVRRNTQVPHGLSPYVKEATFLNPPIPVNASSPIPTSHSTLQLQFSLLILTRAFIHYKHVDRFQTFYTSTPSLPTSQPASSTLSTIQTLLCSVSTRW